MIYLFLSDQIPSEEIPEAQAYGLIDAAYGISQRMEKLRALRSGERVQVLGGFIQELKTDRTSLAAKGDLSKLSLPDLMTVQRWLRETLINSIEIIEQKDELRAPIAHDKVFYLSGVLRICELEIVAKCPDGLIMDIETELTHVDPLPPIDSIDDRTYSQLLRVISYACTNPGEISASLDRIAALAQIEPESEEVN